MQLHSLCPLHSHWGDRDSECGTPLAASCPDRSELLQLQMADSRELAAQLQVERMESALGPHSEIVDHTAGLWTTQRVCGSHSVIVDHTAGLWATQHDRVLSWA